MYGFNRNICMPNIKSISLLIQTRLSFVLRRSKVMVEVICLQMLLSRYLFKRNIKVKYENSTSISSLDIGSLRLKRV